MSRARKARGTTINWAASWEVIARTKPLTFTLAEGDLPFEVEAYYAGQGLIVFDRHTPDRRRADTLRQLGESLTMPLGEMIFAPRERWEPEPFVVLRGIEDLVVIDGILELVGATRTKPSTRRSVVRRLDLAVARRVRAVRFRRSRREARALDYTNPSVPVEGSGAS